MDPIYTENNCTPDHRILWTLALFWQDQRHDSDWLESLNEAVQKDDVQILNHNASGPTTDQFLLHAGAHLPPKDVIRSVKGRLQHLVRFDVPKAFRKNYSIKSIGQTTAEVIEEYVGSQLSRHPMAEADVNERMQKYQLRFPDVDLSEPRYSSHGEYVYNLHLVFVHEERWAEIREEVLQNVTDVIVKAADSKGHLLRAAGILSDHVHIAVGCGIEDAPQDVALSYMNNLAYAHGMDRIYQYGYYAATFGQYDLCAVK